MPATQLGRSLGITFPTTTMESASVKPMIRAAIIGWNEKGREPSWPWFVPVGNREG